VIGQGRFEHTANQIENLRVGHARVGGELLQVGIASYGCRRIKPDGGRIQIGLLCFK